MIVDPKTDETIGVIVTGGGTGGHLFPGIAVAKEFLARDPETRILFVGTGKAVETSVLAREGFSHQVIAASGFKGMGLFGKLSALTALPRGVIGAWGILGTFSPDLVLGVGSYSAGPVAAAAWLKGIPVVLHEQNAIPGLTNRMLSRIARRIYVSLPESADFFPLEKVRIMGNPVRPELILASGRAGENTPGERPFTILVAGGSQGARAINRNVIEALAGIERSESIAFIHQTGTQDETSTREAYHRHGIRAEVGAFFADMGKKYLEADLVICRAGATTIAELACMGKPALLIPYPYAADNHQEHNAAGLVKAGAAEMIREIDLTPEWLLERIRFYRETPGRLIEMSKKAVALGKPEAATSIVNDCLGLIGRATRSPRSEKQIPHNQA